MSASYSLTEVAVDNVDSSGTCRKWDEHQKVRTSKVEGAHIFSDRWQAGFSLPVVQRPRMNREYSGRGDVAASFGYEYLLDWDYIPIRLGGGYNLASLRVGGAVAWAYEDPIDIRRGNLSTGLPERYATAAFSVSYLAPNEWARTLSYTDQTIVGSPVNTSLGKTIALLIQRRWGR